MSELPVAVSQAWANRKGPIVFTTVDKNGLPNAIYASCVKKYNEHSLVVVDNYFNKTKSNILSGSRGTILFITDEDKSYQLKGSIQYLESGEIFEDMKTWNPTRLPGHAVAVLTIDDVYSGAEKLA